MIPLDARNSIKLPAARQAGVYTVYATFNNFNRVLRAVLLMHIDEFLLHSNCIQTCRKNNSLYMGLENSLYVGLENDMRRLSITTGKTLAQWRSPKDDGDTFYVVGIKVDQYSGYVVAILWYYADKHYKLIEFNEGGQELNTYVLDEDLDDEDLYFCWRHGPDDGRPPSCTFSSSVYAQYSLLMACWTPNLSITKVEQCLVILKAKNF
jgi:hypothetical protein